MKECFQEKREGSNLRQENKGKHVISTGDELQYNSGLVPAEGKMGAEDGIAGGHLLSGKLPLAERETGKVVNSHSSQQGMNVHQASGKTPTTSSTGQGPAGSLGSPASPGQLVEVLEDKKRMMPEEERPINPGDS